MATIDLATTPVSLIRQISLIRSVWRIARRYPKATVWIGGVAAIAYVLLRQTVRVPRTY